MVGGAENIFWTVFSGPGVVGSGNWIRRLMGSHATEK